MMLGRANQTCQECGAVNTSTSLRCHNCAAALPRLTQGPRKSYFPWRTLLVLAAVGGAAAVLLPEFERYSIIPRINEGVLAAIPLRSAIADAHARGAPDLACNARGCPIMSNPPGILRTVSSLHSDHTGRITIEYKDPALQPYESRLVLVPQIDGREVDLSRETAAGKEITWKCGGTPQTTVPKKFLPQACR